MNNFLKGMDSIGQLFPAPSSYSDYPQHSAWAGVANAFRQTGDSLRRALKEANNAKRESKQAAQA